MTNSYETIKKFLSDNNTSDEEMTAAWDYLIQTNWKAKAIAKSYPNWYDNNLSIMKQTLGKYKDRGEQK